VVLGIERTGLLRLPETDSRNPANLGEVQGRHGYPRRGRSSSPPDRALSQIAADYGDDLWINILGIGGLDGADRSTYDVLSERSEGRCGDACRDALSLRSETSGLWLLDVALVRQRVMTQKSNGNDRHGGLSTALGCPDP